MIKKIFISLSVVLLLSFVSCGGGSSKEAIKLLERILKLVGIPQSIVVNICQDDNNNGVCEDFEFEMSFRINKGDNLNTILEKITLSSEGTYLLETNDITKPLLLELQDIDNVKYNDGKFTLSFDGLKVDEIKKELSILESMIDKNYLTINDVSKVREMNSVNLFYSKLLKALEVNINNWMDKNLTIEESVEITLKDMANTLKDNGIANDFPQNVNRCDSNNSCIENTIDTIYHELIADKKTVKGKVKDENRVALNNINIKFEYLTKDGKDSNVSTSTDTSGEYMININKNIFNEDSNDSFLIYAYKDGFIPSTKSLKITSNDLYSIDFILRKIKESEIVLEIEPVIHHLGDDSYHGSRNSQFQKNSEGVSFSKKFTISRYQSENYNGGELTFQIKGVQRLGTYDNTILINDNRYELKESPADGSYMLYKIYLDKSNYLEGDNILTINSGQNTNPDKEDYDDFEFSNILFEFK